MGRASTWVVASAVVGSSQSSCLVAQRSIDVTVRDPGAIALRVDDGTDSKEVIAANGHA